MTLTNTQKNTIATELKKWGAKLTPAISFLGETEVPYLKYAHLYSWVHDEKLRTLFCILHSNYADEFEKMNTRLPTDENGNYFWAENSRVLIATFESVDSLINTFSGTATAFKTDDEISQATAICKTFLQQYRGSPIPPNINKMPVYLEIPIFIQANSSVIIPADSIKTVDANYINGLSERATEDLVNGNYDSVITKCRTLLEEVFCYVIELKSETPSDKGDIGKLYNQVKTLYNMHQRKDANQLINELLSGFEKIISSIGRMRNEGSDSHGVGSRRIPIAVHHARLYVNSAMTMADFILSVGENGKQAT
jgi:hypothetical protein